MKAFGVVVLVGLASASGTETSGTRGTVQDLVPKPFTMILAPKKQVESRSSVWTVLTNIVSAAVASPTLLLPLQD